MAKLTYRKLKRQSGPFWALLALHVVVLACGLGAAYYMETHGHIVTGMNNQVVWGTPHVFAVFLIVAASGALNTASIASVFNNAAYKPYARLSGVLAIALLVGGLMVLVLDLGHPDRLIVAMTTHNFKSIFSWNIYFYTGFMGIVAAYLFVMMDRRASQSELTVKAVGMIAFIWRLALTTGTGSIFGFLIAREAFDSAIMAPLFIASSFLYGLSFTVLVLLVMTSQVHDELLPPEMLVKFRRLLIIFCAAVLYFTFVQHLTRMYQTAHHGYEAFILRDGGVYPLIFWLGQIVMGSVLPMGLLFVSTRSAAPRLALGAASMLFLLGGLSQLYVIIIGGQAFPLKLFPGMVVSSSFFDGQVGHYVPSLPEVVLGISGISLSMLIVTLALRLLPFLPRSATS